MTNDQNMSKFKISNRLNLQNYEIDKDSKLLGILHKQVENSTNNRGVARCKTLCTIWNDGLVIKQ